jgi:predicted transcriptional regulator
MTQLSRALTRSWLCTSSQARATMSSAAEKAVEALELLSEEMREPAAAYLLSQAKKFPALKDAIDEGMADVEAGRVVPWDLEDFLKRACAQTQR